MKICFGYSLEVPQRGTSNEYPQYMFFRIYLADTQLPWTTPSKLLSKPITEYHIYQLYSDRQTWANSVDPDEMLQNAASHQGLHCLPLIQQFLDTTSGSKCTCSNSRTSMVQSWGVQILKVNTVKNMPQWLFKCFCACVQLLIYRN